MKISESWLREWVNPDIDTETLVAKLTMAGLEVDAVEEVAKPFSGVVVAEILSAEPHPDADKLRVCQVNDGSQELQIVCGAPNARPGIRVPLASVGAELPGDFKIEKAKLRGVESNGMLCARDELGVAGYSEGLWELSSNLPLGEDIRSLLALDDKLIDIDLTPNRADCLSARGIARDIGVVTSTDVTEPEILALPAESDATFPVKITDGEACPIYIGRVIEGVDLSAKTPDWIIERLARSDIGSIHPAVDVTNYVMLELGQPMHAFDLAKLNGQIEVRYAKAEEKITLLDDRELSLDESILLITDGNGPLAMAGIMGGKDSGITNASTDIFLESAFFNPLAITGKARNYGLHTDSSHRFERGVDPALQELAIERATQLLISIAGGRPGPVQVEKVDAYVPELASIELRSMRLEQLLGCQFETTQVEEILQRLGLEILESSSDRWLTMAPSWRFDLKIEEDLVEEVARIYGYDKLPERTLLTAQPIEADQEGVAPRRSYKEQLISRGFREVISYSFIAPDLHQLCFPNASSIPVKNPIAEDMSVMQISLVPGLFKAAEYNLNRQQSDLRLFESGMVFSPTDSGSIKQENKIAGLMTGSRRPEGWANDNEELDFYDLKNEVELLLNQNADFIPSEWGNVAHPGQSAEIRIEGQLVGRLAKVHPQIQSTLDFGKATFVFELNEYAVRNVAIPSFSPLSKFPAVRRDLALVVEHDLQVSELIKEVHRYCGDLLTEARIFDIYRGQGVDSNEKSIGLGLTFRDNSRTLNDELVTQKITDLIEHLKTSHNARQR